MIRGALYHVTKGQPHGVEKMVSVMGSCLV